MDAFDRVGRDYFPGSSVEGKVYQDLSFLGIDHPAHRGATMERAAQINAALPLAGKQVLDIGCSNGGLSMAMTKLGAYVVGVDRDPAAIAVAEAVAAEKGLDTEFHVMDINSSEFLEFADQPWDVVVWLSQYMWLWKEAGRLRAQRTLRFLTDRSDALVFETAQSLSHASAGAEYVVDGKDGLLDLLWYNTSYDQFHDLGYSPGGWASRNVIIGSRKRGLSNGPSMLIAGMSGSGKSYAGVELAKNHGVFHFDVEPLMAFDTRRWKEFCEDPVGFCSEYRRPLVVTWGMDRGGVDIAQTMIDAGWIAVWLEADRDNLAAARANRGDRNPDSQGVHDLWDAQQEGFEGVNGWTVVPAFEGQDRRDQVRELAALLGV